MASATALMVGFLVLAGDSAKPQCESYRHDQLTFSYTVRCDGNAADSGTITLESGGDDTGAGNAVEAHGAVTVTGEVRYDIGQCGAGFENSKPGGVGVPSGFWFELNLDTEQASAGFRCDGAWDTVPDCSSTGSSGDSSCELELALAGR